MEIDPNVLIECFFDDLRSGAALQSVGLSKAGPDDALEKFIREDQLRLSGATGRAAQDPAVRRHPEPLPGGEGMDLDLHKNAGDRRTRAIRGWLSAQLALGKSVNELVEHARRHDPEIAGVIADLGASRVSA